MTTPITWIDMLIVAASTAWQGDGEVLASGIGIVPRLAAGLAKLTHNPALLMTDSEAYLMEEPVPLGPRRGPLEGFEFKPAGYMPFERVFDTVWRGKRHAMVTPTQIDRYGQGNISCLGGVFEKPKVQMLGVRGFPGNSINHINSMFIPAHSRRVFVENEVDMVGSVGYNPARWPVGVKQDFMEIRLIVTDLCVMDFQGPDHAIRVRSLHPGVSLAQVQDQTGFPLIASEQVLVTPSPTQAQMQIIQRLDPHNLRATVIKHNPVLEGVTA